MRERQQGDLCPECGHPLDTRPDDTDAHAAFKIAASLLLIAVILQIVLAPVAIIFAVIASFQLSRRASEDQYRLSHRAWKQRRLATVLFCIWFCELAAMIVISAFWPNWQFWLD